MAVMECTCLCQPSSKDHVHPIRPSNYHREPVTATSSHIQSMFAKIVLSGSYGTAFDEGVTAAFKC